MSEDDERAYSAELLRLAVPQMARHGSSMNPLNYAVWYTYVSEAKPALAEAVDALLREQTPLSADQMRSLYERHVSEYDIEAIRRVRSDLQGVMDEVARSASASQARSSAFEASLEAHVARLSQPQGVDIQSLLASVIGETRSMRDSVHSLRTQLDSAVTEVGRLHAELERVREETLRDPLTGIANRRGFERALDGAIQGAEDGLYSNCCLVLADIDHFKQVNDRYGHVLGDRVIASVGAALRHVVRDGQTAARYGGEEFAVVMPGATLDQACRVAEQIRVTVERGRVMRRDTQSTLCQVTVSLGIAQHWRGQSARQLIERADRALYAAKQGGRNRCSVARDTPRERLQADRARA